MTFEEIVSEFSNTIFNHCLKMIGNKDDAEDLTQEVFVKIHRSLRSFRGDSSIKTWIYRITVNTCLTKLSSKEYKQIRKNKVDINYSENKISRETPETNFIKKENEQMLMAAIKNLDAGDREIVLLFYVDSLSYKEISDVLNLPIGTVSIKLFRARQKLKQFILQEEQYEM